MTTISGLLALDLEKNGYTIVGKVADDNAYRGIILVNKDSAINRFRDMAGKTISSPGKDALAGHMMPMYFLYQNG
jgi:phosphonate transport system substrate-binding protein